MTQLTPSQTDALTCIAPSHPGSGWDIFCREVGKILFDLGLTDSPVQVTNMAGQGGGAAFDHVTTTGAQDSVVIAASQATAIGLAQKTYGAATADQLRLLGAIGADAGVLAVAQDSPLKTLDDMITALKADPRSLCFAGGSEPGGYDHLKVLTILQEAGQDMTDVSYSGGNGGLGAVIDMLDGKADVMSGDMSEVVDVLNAKDIRILAVLTQSRLPEFGDLPTAVEQGLDVIALNWRGFYVPKDMAEGDFAAWVDRLRAVAGAQDWAAAMESNGMVPFTLLGTDAQPWLMDVIASTTALSRELGLISDGARG